MSSRTFSRSTSSYGKEREWLFRRFAATIPLKRKVCVAFRDPLRIEVHRAIGTPYKCLEHMLYLQLVSQRLIGIPKGCVLSIEGFNPMPEKQPLAVDDPKFGQFRRAIADAEYVRVDYLQELPPDPAITDEALTKRGLPTIVEGEAAAIDDTTLSLAPAEKALQGVVPNTVIPLARVLDITFLVPRPSDTTREIGS